MRDPQRAQGHRAESCQESLGDITTLRNSSTLLPIRLVGSRVHTTRERNPVKARPSQRQDIHTSVMLLCGHRHMLIKDRLFKCKSLHGSNWGRRQELGDNLSALRARNMS